MQHIVTEEEWKKQYQRGYDKGKEIPIDSVDLREALKQLSELESAFNDPHFFNGSIASLGASNLFKAMKIMLEKL